MKMLPLNKVCFLIFIRKLCTNNILCKKQESNFMQKILKQTKPKKKWTNETNVMPNIAATPAVLSQGAAEGKKSANSKRVSVLNKLFMKNITDLMATGTSSSEFLGHGIEINRVSVTPDFKGVNVFWVAKGTETDENIEKILSKNAGALRHELSQLRVMGVVPKIHFVKDKGYAKLVEVDARLAKADFGEDYIPIQPFKFKSEIHLHTTLSPKIKEKLEEMDEETETNEVEDELDNLPPMRMDILGLNHADIMTRVQRGIKKSRASHRKSNENLVLSTSVNEDPIEYNSYSQQKTAFTQFLLKRQLMLAKAKSTKEKYNPEYEYLRSESIKYEDTQLPEELNDNDYIEEDEEDTRRNEQTNK